MREEIERREQEFKGRYWIREEDIEKGEEERKRREQEFEGRKGNI